MSCNNIFGGGKEGKMYYNHMVYEIQEESLIKGCYKVAAQTLADIQCKCPNYNPMTNLTHLTYTVLKLLNQKDRHHVRIYKRADYVPLY